MIKNINNTTNYALMEAYNGAYKIMNVDAEIKSSLDNKTKVYEQDKEIPQRLDSLYLFKWKV